MSSGGRRRCKRSTSSRRIKPRAALQTFHRPLAAFLASLHHHEDPRRAGVGRQVDFADIYQANSWIAQLAFENGFDLLAQGFTQPFPMIFLSTPSNITPR